MNFMKLAEDELDNIIADRRYLHENPELSQKEENTVLFISERLNSLKIENIVVPKGGVLGFIGGSEHENDKKTVLLRADMDALPVKENMYNLKQKKTCVSRIEGISHACGHDAHTAMLLAAAKLLKQHEEQINGRIILFFERAEEAGGNILYLLRYIYENKIRVDSCYGTHVKAELPAGCVGLERGTINAGGFGFECTIHGKGGHGARPHEANSPIDCFVALYQALNQISGKYVAAGETLTFSIGKVSAGSKRNIIPADLDFAGSFRFFSHDTGVYAKKIFLKLCESVCNTYGCTFELTKEVGPTLPLVNNDYCAELMEQIIAETVGEQQRVRELPQTGSESFSAAQRLWPGVFTHIGIKNEALGSGAPHHSPEFDMDESVLYIGTALYAAYALKLLEAGEIISFEKYEGSPDDLYRDICYHVD